MGLRTPLKRQTGEPTIALINIVFLMLIFFMIAGALAPPLDKSISLVDTLDLAGRSPPDAPVLRADGTMLYKDQPITAEAVVAAAEPGADGPTVRIVPDQTLPAQALMETARALREAGAAEIWLITERGLE